MLERVSSFPPAAFADEQSNSIVSHRFPSPRTHNSSNRYSELGCVKCALLSMYSKDHPQRDVTGLCSVKIGYLLNPVAALLSRSEPDVKGNRKCLFFHTKAGSSSSLPSLGVFEDASYLSVARQPCQPGRSDSWSPLILSPLEAGRIGSLVESKEGRHLI